MCRRFIGRVVDSLLIVLFIRLAVRAGLLKKRGTYI